MALTDRELAEFSGEHLYYEIWMLFGLAGILTNLPAPKDELELMKKNALIEAFGVHVRLLINFFYPARVEADDVTAERFMEDVARWKAAVPPIGATLSKAKGRGDKEIAHLTTRRIAGTPPHKAWPAQDLVNDLKALMKLFVNHALPKRLHGRVKALVDQL